MTRQEFVIIRNSCLQPVTKFPGELLLLIILILFTNGTSGQEKGPVFKVGGYVKSDFLLTRYNNGDIGEESPLRDLHIPGFIPVGDVEHYSWTDFHVKESRFYLDVSTLNKKWPLRAYVELDFQFSPAGNERVSNSYNPRLRHFFFEAGKLLIGQTWSVFIVGTLPDDLDFIGAAEGAVFARQPQIRFTVNSWQIALENPVTTLSQREEGSLIATNSGVMPDIIIKKNFEGKWGDFAIATIFRQLHAVDSLRSNQKTYGLGIASGGRIKAGNSDDIRLSVAYGKGLGRYLALNFVPGAIIDERNELKAIGTINGYIAYLHYWTNKWRSSINFSAFNALNNINLAGQGANKTAWSASANILYSPLKDLIFGIEYMHAYRGLEGGTDGSFDRLQISAKYVFGWNSHN